MADDFRIHVRTDDADALIARLEGTSDHEGRFSVSRDGDDVFVYANTLAEAQRAAEIIGGDHPVERWLDDEDRWDDEPPGETWEEEELEHGYAPWEVRVDLGSRHAAAKLERQLESEGYSPLRHWSYVIVGATTREEAETLAARLHGHVEAGGEVVWETQPGNPFAIFGGMGQL